MPARKSSSFVLPREHGAYIILIASWVWGIIFSPLNDALGFVLVFAVAFHLFLVQESVRRTLRSPAGSLHPAVLAIVTAAAAAAAVLIIKTPFILVIAAPVALLSLLYFSIAHKGPFVRSALGFILLSLITPATIVASGNTDYFYLFLSWLGIGFFATSSVAIVGIRLDQPKADERALIFHIIYSIVVLAYSIIIGSLMPGLGIALVAIVRYILVATAKSRYIVLPLKTVGIIESIVTIIALTVSALLV
jgi:YwiC-like protein